MTDLEEFVRAGDPDRHAATLAASEQARAKLWPLYAFNLEIARAPWVTSEPMIAEMRLQFWTDVLDAIEAGKPPRAHHVAEPLARLWRAQDLPVALGHAMIAARHRDITRDAFANAAALHAHLNSTSGNMMWLAAQTLGAGLEAEATIRHMGAASGLANWFLAVPQLAARGWSALPDTSDSAIASLAQGGLARLAMARAARREVPSCAIPALLVGWQAGPILARAVNTPALVRAGGLQMSEFARRGQLLLRAVSGRW